MPPSLATEWLRLAPWLQAALPGAYSGLLIEKAVDNRRYQKLGLKLPAAAAAACRWTAGAWATGTGYRCGLAAIPLGKWSKPGEDSFSTTLAFGARGAFISLAYRAQKLKLTITFGTNILVNGHLALQLVSLPKINYLVKRIPIPACSLPDQKYIANWFGEIGCVV